MFRLYILHFFISIGALSPVANAEIGAIDVCLNLNLKGAYDRCITVVQSGYFEKCAVEICNGIAEEGANSIAVNCLEQIKNKSYSESKCAACDAISTQSGRRECLNTGND